VRNVGKINATTIGTVTVSVTAPAAGSFKVTVYGEVVGQRQLSIMVNNGSTKTVTLTGDSSQGWQGPSSPVAVTVTLRAGANVLTFSNDSAPGPDLDQIRIEQV
jgi:hypothetical protein